MSCFLRPDEKKKCFCMYMKPPTQCADDVSTVLGVSVVNELPGISFSFLSIYLPDVVNTRFTQASNRIGHTALCSHTVNTGFFPPPHCLVKV